MSSLSNRVTGAFLSTGCVAGLVSVIIPTYNRQEFLRLAIASIERQSYRPIEVIVVDDGSRDETLSVIANYVASNRDPELTVHLYEQVNSGACAARNRGVLNATGEYVQFLDSDDLLGEDKLYDGVRVLSQDCKVDFVYCLRGDFDSGSGVVTEWKGKVPNLEENPCPSEVALNSLWTALPLFRRSVIDKIGPWDTRLSSFQDWEFMGRAAFAANKIVAIDKIQAYCRNHTDERLSVTPFGSANGLHSGVIASKGLMRVVCLDSSCLRATALEALSRRCVSAVRVAVATGQRRVAEALLDELADVSFPRYSFRVSLMFWRGVNFLPEQFLKWMFGVVLPLRNRVKSFLRANA